MLSMLRSVAIAAVMTSALFATAQAQERLVFASQSPPGSETWNYFKARRSADLFPAAGASLE